MKVHTRLLVIVCTCLFLSESCANAGTRKERSVYQSVAATAILDQSTQIIRDFPLETSPEFLIEEGKLLLLIQSTYTKYNLVVAVRMTRWDSVKLATLLRAHEKLRTMLPNPDAADGGIKWLNP